ncbi:MAG TPA: VanW family protein, partial [Minicystis sp.]|nr:VanW family protein [Minicystis sp.]
TEPPRDAAARAAALRLRRRVVLTFGGKALVDATLGELGATVDVASVEEAALRVARTGGLFRQIGDALAARRGEVRLRTRTLVPIDVLAARLERPKEELDTPPLAAKLDVATHRAAAPHRPGRYLDAFAAAEAIQRAIDASPDPTVTVVVPLFEIPPSASSDVVEKIDTRAVLARYDTRFGYVGGQANRAQNVRTAAERMDGVVLMPGEVVSFNANVGPRSIENGFATAPEIYKGEMREGVGGGTCQVAGTLHAAAYFAGLEVLERANHSRPSGYIRMGLDATVVYPTVDLKLENPFDFPVVIHSIVDKGELTFELLGRERPATVDFSTETLGTADFKRKIEEKEGLPEGKFVLKQKGIRGYSIKKTRTIRFHDGKEKIEVTHDTYPPTFEIYWVPPGTDPAVLPPLGEGAGRTT